MNATVLAALNGSERQLIAETEPKALALLDEDEVAALHTRIQRARNKYVGIYRRGASARVVDRGARGEARPKNRTAALKVEAFEDALSRVSRRLAALSRESASALRTERLEAARAAKAGTTKSASASPQAKEPRSATTTPRGDRALRSPAREKNRAGTRALGDRRQAKRDAR